MWQVPFRTPQGEIEPSSLSPASPQTWTALGLLPRFSRVIHPIRFFGGLTTTTSWATISQPLLLSPAWQSPSRVSISVALYLHALLSIYIYFAMLLVPAGLMDISGQFPIFYHSRILSNGHGTVSGLSMLGRMSQLRSRL